MNYAIIIYFSGVIPAFVFTRYMWYRTYPEYKDDFEWIEAALWAFYAMFSWVALPAAFIAYLAHRRTHQR